MVPMVVFEIKPSLTHPPAIADVMECLLQAYYYMVTYHLKNLTICLTDFESWYYYSVSKPNCDTPLEIESLQTVRYRSQVPSLEDLESHLQFLVELCTELCTDLGNKHT